MLEVSTRHYLPALFAVSDSQRMKCYTYQSYLYAPTDPFTTRGGPTCPTMVVS